MDFFDHYPALQQAENWQAIIDLGETALQEDLLARDAAHIHLRLSSCYHYQGMYAQALQHAEAGTKSAIEVQHPNFEVRGLYLQSAAHRCLYAAAEDQYVVYDLAHTAINAALEKLDGSEIKDFTKGKVYFNAGALEQDVDKNHEKAHAYHLKAMEYFTPGSDDYQRTVIRYARTFLDIGNPAAAREELAEKLTQPILPESKTGVQLNHLRAKIAVAEGQDVEASRYAAIALSGATNLGMCSVKAQIQQLQKAILSSKEPQEVRAPQAMAGVAAAKEFF